MPNLLPFLMLAVIWAGSLVIAVLPLSFALTRLDPWLVLGAFALFPFLFVPSFITLAGLMSSFAQSKIIPGRFPREAFHKIYGWRRVYGICWTQVFYFKPLYAISLAVPRFKSYMLRLFGYKGPSTSFVVYPDTWLRDLPVLEIGKDAYLANRSTIGTNICLNDNTILVDAIRVRDKGLVGHLVVLAPGCSIEAGAEIGVVTSIGLRCWIGPRVSVKPNCGINHGCNLEEGCEIGTRAYVGLKVRVGKGVKVPAGANIPEGAVIMQQSDMDRYYSSETKVLQDFAAHMAAVGG
jgi:carbonic anhydrase/acetyltransferase-like protein (isoleucine patch superfamily)